MSASLPLLPQILLTGMAIGATYALVAMGFNLIHNATGIVNFAQCEFISLGGLLLFSLGRLLGLPVVLAFPLAVAAVTLVGVLVERGVIRPARSRETLVLVFLTIGVSGVLRGVAQQVWGTDNVGVPAFSGEAPIRLPGGAVLVPQHLWIVAIALASMLLLQVFFQRTLTGKAMRAAAADRRAAALVGIPVERMVMLAFALAGALGAVAGTIIAPLSTASYDTGIMLGLKGFAAAILGGYGHFAGAVLGGLLLGVLEALTAGLIASQYKDAVAFCLLLLVLFLRPSGLLGPAEEERV
jgi:branched-chain amino acid transport system permease protein